MQKLIGEPRILRHGEFFGAADGEQRTQSFAFARAWATKSAEELPRHTHEDGSFVLVLRGRYVTAASDDVCGPGTLVFNPPGTTHRDRFVGGAGQFLHVSASREISELMLAGRPMLLPSIRLLSVLREVASELSAPDADSHLLLEGLGLELVGRTSRLRRRPDPRPPKWLVEARDLLREDHGLTISEVAHLVSVHRVHLARAFRQYFHCTPGAFARACRIETACRLLQRPDHTLAEIALHAGYSDQSQFTRAFKRSSGRSPAEWRRTHS
jgi:AraC family transcriptional regulator